MSIKHGDEYCRDPACLTCSTDYRIGEVCDCGDWKSQHQGDDHAGRCKVCAGTSAPWDSCNGFRFFGWELRYPWDRSH